MSSDAPEWHCLRCNFDLPPGDRPPTTRWGALGLPDTRAQSVDDARALLRR